MKIKLLHLCFALLVILTGVVLLSAQETGSLPETSAPAGAQAPGAPAYQPKFAGDPARSEAEAQALGYMRTALRAEKLYKKRHNKYAESLTALAGTGSFTKRMARTTDRGDYTASFHPKKEGFTLSLIPKQYDAQRRAFYADEDGVIHAEEGKPADAESPRLK